MNQVKMVKEHLEAGKSITSIEAFQRWGITRLSDKIFRLRKMGMQIDAIPTEGTNRYGDPVHFSTYRLSNINELIKEKHNG